MKKPKFTDAEMALLNLLMSGEKENIELAAQLLTPTLNYKDEYTFLSKFGYHKFGLATFEDFFGHVQIYLEDCNADLLHLPLPKSIHFGIGNTYSKNTLPDLSNLNITELSISGMKLKELPNNLPNTIERIICAYIGLSNLSPNLPDSLIELHCGFNKGLSFPENLPNSMEVIFCEGCELTKLPNNLPNNLIFLRCNDNNLTELPILPDKIEVLDCYNNKHLNLNNVIFPNSFKELNYSDGQISEDKLKELQSNGVYTYKHLQ